MLVFVTAAVVLLVVVVAAIMATVVVVICTVADVGTEAPMTVTEKPGAALATADATAAESAASADPPAAAAVSLPATLLAETELPAGIVIVYAAVTAVESSRDRRLAVVRDTETMSLLTPRAVARPCVTPVLAALLATNAEALATDSVSEPVSTVEV